jgi:4-alpha-glucanotransferase
MPNKSDHIARAKKSARGAGILMHITSLPSGFGIGDLGPEAFRFADFLAEGKQTYWQFLPMNPIEAGQAYSPYSATSSMAGNVLLISPEKLKKNGLLSSTDLRDAQTQPTGVVDFLQAERVKKHLLDKAFNNFTGRKAGGNQLEKFLASEKWWLDDYALYAALKEKFRKPWYEWPEQIRTRRAGALPRLQKELSGSIKRICWQQFIFFQQWKELRTYCNQSKISLVGDVPFYVSYDSSDVWANQEIFSLYPNGKLKGVAGVPPDYFNNNGQLWGMPVFNWSALKKKKYDWWISRIKKNLQMYDLVRLDHFRAFSAYWEVPAKAKTARRGKWKPGPGADFFQAVKRKFARMPFIAEDLGDIDNKVLALRDKFLLPGMKVLQFGFGGNMATSEYIPHNHGENFVVYTGTHDNNTTKGWFRLDAGTTERSNLAAYLGKKVNAKNVDTEMIRLAYSSVSKVAIIPMQDLLGLDERARMNRPASVDGNWRWRMERVDLTRVGKSLIHLTTLYNRLG